MSPEEIGIRRVTTPRALRRALAGDLDRVVLKALRKEPQRRYATAAELAEDLRLQLERMHGAFVPSTREYYRFFGLNREKLALARPDALVMHPGPMNRGVEIASSVADGIQSVIKEQVEMGVAVRMAVLDALSRNLPGGTNV